MLRRAISASASNTPYTDAPMTERPPPP